MESASVIKLAETNTKHMQSEGHLTKSLDKRKITMKVKNCNVELIVELKITRISQHNASSEVIWILLHEFLENVT